MHQSWFSSVFGLVISVPAILAASAVLAQQPSPAASVVAKPQDLAQPAPPKAVPPAVTPEVPVSSGVERVRVLIAPEQETSMVAAMTGRIQKINIHLGGSFQKGSVLMGFDCSENAARKKIADAELKAARDNYDAKVRLQALQAAGDMEVSLAASAAEKAVGQVELSQTQIAQCSIIAPFSGRVARVHVKQHQGVNVGTPLADIISNGPLKLRLNVPSRWLRTLKVGSSFSVMVDETGRSYPAKVSAISARIDAAAQTIEIEGRFSSSFRELLPGMSGTAQFSELK